MAKEDIDWDDAYANAAYIRNGDAYPDLWARDAASFRAVSQHDLDIPHGKGERQRYDLFFPEGDSRGLFVFIHGGYWRAFDKSYWSHLAGGAVSRGWTVMLPSYDLCPDVSISAITRQIGSAIDHAAHREPGPIVIAGHSAGGHLAARMMCEGAPLQPGVVARVRRGLGISGLYDLRPLQKTKMNETLRISDREALTESPLFLEPRHGAEVIAWVGEDERPEFIRQSRDFVAGWKKKGADVAYAEEPGRHHFDVIESLSNPASEMIARALAG